MRDFFHGLPISSRVENKWNRIQLINRKFAGFAKKEDMKIV
jgi:hypothetical protein